MFGLELGEDEGTVIRGRADTTNSAGAVRARDGQEHKSSQKSGRGLPPWNNADISNRPDLDLKGLGDPSWVSLAKLFNGSMARSFCGVSASSPLNPAQFLASHPNGHVGAKAHSPPLLCLIQQ